MSVEEIKQEEKPSPKVKYPPRFKVVAPSETLTQTVRNERLKPKKFSGEREKTAEDIAIIEYCNLRGRELAQKYEFDWADIPMERIHLLPHPQYEKLASKLGIPIESSGNADIAYPDIIVRDFDSPLAQTVNVFHEAIHGQSTRIVKTTPSEERLLLVFKRKRWKPQIASRAGLSLYHWFRSPTGFVYKENYIFSDLEEAIVARFTHEAMSQALNDPRCPFQEEARGFEELRGWFESLSKSQVPCVEAPTDKFVTEDIKKIKNTGGNNKDLLTYIERFRTEHKRAPLLIPYAAFRNAYEELLGATQEKNSHQFENSEEVHKVFIQAAINGKIVALARLIDKTFGKGSFRRLGERGLLEFPQLRS